MRSEEEEGEEGEVVPSSALYVKERVTEVLAGRKAALLRLLLLLLPPPATSMATREEAAGGQEVHGLG